MMLTFSNVTFAEDVYACQEDDWEVYVSTERISVNNDKRVFIKNGIKFVTNGEIIHIETADFYVRNGEWWGNILMDGYRLGDDYLLDGNETEIVILNIAKMYR